MEEGDLKSHLEEVLSEVEKDHAIKAPKTVTNMVRDFKFIGRKDSIVGVIIAQFSRLPPIIAPVANANIGVII